MAQQHSTRIAKPRLRDRVAARRSGWSAQATGFALIPEPRSIGNQSRGRELCAGRYHFGGHVVEAGQTGLWSADHGSDPAFEAGRQGFGWLDDLAALGSAAAQTRARAWVEDWLDRYDRGIGPGWTAPLAGRRVIRMIHHSKWINGPKREYALDLSRHIDQHLRFLGRRWRSAEPGLARFEAVGGLVIGGLTLKDRDRWSTMGLRALEILCRTRISPDGGVPSRNPEELLAVFEILAWCDSALGARGIITRPEHQAALERVAQTLRVLRHADGGLARFHGGGRGTPGAAESALALADIRPAPIEKLAMGYARLARGRTTVIVDASPTPTGAASSEAHASTLALEMTSARRPVIVNCGAGAGFGAEWERAARATPSHSTLGIDGFSSARLGTEDRNRTLLVEGPRDVPVELDLSPGPASLVTGHDGYSQSHGLIHVRRLDLGTDGRALAGEDVLTASGDNEKRRFTRSRDRALKSGAEGIAFTIRFHLHPDVDARLDLGGRAVSLQLPSGEIWIFRHSSASRMSLDPSVYLENTRATPVATQQIVLAGQARDDFVSVKWSLAKAKDSPVHLRDLNPAAAD